MVLSAAMTPLRLSVSAALLTFLSVGVGHAGLAPCAGTPKAALKCDAKQTRKAVCQPCEGTKLKGCAGKIAGSFGQAQSAANGALNAEKKGKTSKVEAGLGKVQQELDKTTTALHALIDKNHGTQSCKDAVDALINEFRVEVVEEVTGGTASTTTTTSTSTSSTTSTTLAVRACPTVHVFFFSCGLPMLPVVVDSSPAGIVCPSNCMADFGPGVGEVQFSPEVTTLISFGGDCTANGTLDLSKAVAPGCQQSCDCMTGSPG